MTGIDQFTAEDVGEMDAASKSEALGESWDSYTVQLNDAVVTLPCAAADLEAAGLKMDQSVTAEDQTVEIGEYITGYYNDTAGNRLNVTLVNPSAEALPVSQCLIGKYFRGYKGAGSRRADGTVSGRRTDRKSERRCAEKIRGM